jgi:hypothetical protein
MFFFLSASNSNTATTIVAEGEDCCHKICPFQDEAEDQREVGSFVRRIRLSFFSLAEDQAAATYPQQTSPPPLLDQPPPLRNFHSNR